MKDDRYTGKFLLEAYRLFPEKDSFFRKNNSFNRLAGTDVLMQQIKDGITEDAIRKSWENDLNRYKQTRKKIPAVRRFLVYSFNLLTPSKVILTGKIFPSLSNCISSMQVTR